MWTDEQMNAAKYVAFVDYETKQPLNIGTVEISGANGGIYFMQPVPPFGGLSNENNSIAGVKSMARVPGNAFSIQATPRGLPVPDRAQNDQYVIHDFGNIIP